MATVLLVGVDLFLRGKLEAMLPEHHLVSVEGVDPPDLVIADIARIDAHDVAETFPDVPLLGFTNHKDTEGLRRAHAAGFDRVVVKSALFERPGEVIEGLLTSLE
jgi:DNA-binding NarL/FixJ family response regulator